MSDMKRMPRLMSTDWIAKRLGDGWTSERVRKMMRKEGKGTKIGDRWFITRTEMRAWLPALSTELEVSAAEEQG